MASNGVSAHSHSRQEANSSYRRSTSLDAFSTGIRESVRPLMCTKHTEAGAEVRYSTVKQETTSVVVPLHYGHFTERAERLLHRLCGASGTTSFALQHGYLEMPRHEITQQLC